MSNLLVQNIKHTNNTTAMSVDTSGNVTTTGNTAVGGTLAVTGVHTVVAHVNASVGQQFLMFYPTRLATPSNTSSEASYSSFGVTFLG